MAGMVAAAPNSIAGEAVSAIAKGHAPRANQAPAEPPRACPTDFQAALAPVSAQGSEHDKTYA